MTRLFDALRKAHATVAPAPLAPVPLAPALAPPEPRARRPVLELASAPIEAARRSIVHLPEVPGLPTDEVREMAGLRVRLEAMLAERVPRTVMFLAAQGGEGTTTVVARFAWALTTDSQLHVLLVDLHARRPGYARDGHPLTDDPSRRAVTGGDGRSARRNLDLMPVPEAVATAGGGGAPGAAEHPPGRGGRLRLDPARRPAGPRVSRRRAARAGR